MRIKILQVTRKQENYTKNPRTTMNALSTSRLTLKMNSHFIPTLPALYCSPTLILFRQVQGITCPLSLSTTSHVIMMYALL